MRPELKFVLKAIMSDPEALGVTWDANRSDLHAYIDLELDGEDATARFPKIKAYLDEDEAFRRIYDELKDLFLKTRHGELVQPPMTLDLDLSFLNVIPEPLWQTIERGVKRLWYEIGIFLEKTGSGFAPLPQSLAPQLVSTGPTRDRTPGAEQAAHLLSIPSSDERFSFGLKIGPVAENRTTISIQIRQASPEQPLNRARMTLRDSNRRMLESDLTLANKAVTFHDLEAGHYLVEVKYQDQIWELPLTFAPQEEAT